MITAEEVRKLWGEIKGKLPENLLGHIDAEETERSNSGRILYAKLVIRLKRGVARDAAWAVRNFITDYKTMCSSMPAGAKVSVEYPPWKHDHVVAVARFRGVLKQLGVPDEKVRAESGPP
eukprot:10306946-Lingulodinium_polyedra.AAC.1